jgi:hypothetical protein
MKTFVLLCLGILAVQGDKNAEISYSECSRQISRKVRRFLQKDIYPMLSFDPTQLPTSCALNPLRDLFHDHELHKKQLSQDDWKVRFECEYY